MTQSGHDGLEIAAVQNAVSQVKWEILPELLRKAKP